jgi:hypothetical protein
VALGASNLTRGFLTVVDAARLAWGEPLEIFTALGHGRSYGTKSAFLARTLPSIKDCRLWSDLQDRPAAATLALVTDVGNDILYGAPVDEILAWVEDCLLRLKRLGADVVVTDLPLASIARLSEAHFLLFRSVLVPSCRLSLAQVTDRATAVALGLDRIAAAHDAAFFRLRPEWYGFDPIHIRPALWDAAWREILLGDGALVTAQAAAGRSLTRWLKLYLAAPEQRWLLGRERKRPQPSLTLGRGTSVFIY